MLHTNGFKKLSYLLCTAIAFVGSIAIAQDESGFCAPGMPCYQAARSESSLNQLLDVRNSSAVAAIDTRNLASSDRTELASTSATEVVRDNQIFYADDRVRRSRQRGSEYAPIGLVINPDNTATSGTLISECHVLTSIHMLTDDFRTINLQDPPRVRFAAGQADPSGFADVVGGKVVAVGNYQRRLANFEEDWMVVELDRDSSGNCIGTNYGTVKVNPISSQSIVGRENSIELAGFPSDLDQDAGRGVWVDHNCTIQDAANSRWYHDCSEGFGSSGGPLLRKLQNGRVELIGIHAATLSDSQTVLSTWDRSKANIATPINGFFDRIRRFLNN